MSEPNETQLINEPQLIRVFGANDVDSLKTLELSSEKGENNLLAKVVGVRLALVEENIKATAVIYEEIDILSEDINLGHLIFSSFTTDVDQQAQIAIHKTNEEPFVCAGKAFVKNKPVNVLVFREKQ